MPIKSFKMGPGTLRLGVAGVQDVSCQIRNCRVVPSENVTTTDDLVVLCGETLKGDSTATYTFTLEGTLVQDIDAAGVVAYTWDNRGDEVPVEFIPSTTEGRKVTGTVRLVPLVIGGDVAARNTSDFTWSFTVDPVLAAVV